MNMDEQKKSNNLGPRKTNTNDDVEEDDTDTTVDGLVTEMIRHRQRDDNLTKLFKQLDKDNDGLLTREEWTNGILTLTGTANAMTKADAEALFEEADADRSGTMDYKEFVSIIQQSGYDRRLKYPTSMNRDSRGLIQIEPSREKYFGETVRKYNAGKAKTDDLDFLLAKQQHLVQELYETRIASLQRFVAMCVLFHCMARKVERFFDAMSFGRLGYRVDRTHSIVRIATTASPTSGSDVRHQIERLRLWKRIQHSVRTIEDAYQQHLNRKQAQRHLEEHLEQHAADYVRLQKESSSLSSSNGGGGNENGTIEQSDRIHA
jgi:hypothetical protein